MVYTIDFKKCADHTEAEKYLEEWGGTNQNNTQKFLIIFNIKNPNWYIHAYDGVGYLIKGKVSDIPYLTSLNEILGGIYSELSETDLPNIIVNCESNKRNILEHIQSVLCCDSIMGGEYKLDFKKLYNPDFFSRDLIESYRNAAWQLLAAIKDDNLSTEEQKLKIAIPAIFLFRHAIELGLKALIFEIDSTATNLRHDLIHAWEIVQKDLKKRGRLKPIECDKMNHALELLKRWSLDKSEELFRYLDSKDVNLINCSPFNLFGTASRLSEVINYLDDVLLALYEEKRQANCN